MNEIKWWAYQHVNGNVSVKRYFDIGDINAARDSSFVRAVTLPFQAAHREDAMAQARVTFTHDNPLGG